MIFVCDLDGTLDACSVYPIDELKKRGHELVLCTASHPDDVKSRHPSIYNRSKIIHGCCGTRVYSVEESKWLYYDEETIAPEVLIGFDQHRMASEFPHKTDPWFVSHGRYASCSVLGKNYEPWMKPLYVDYDVRNRERIGIVKATDSKFFPYVARTGGTTGVDYFPSSLGKVDVFKYVDVDECFYLGDDMGDYGGDWDAYNYMACRGRTNRTYWVKDPSHSRMVILDILKELRCR